MFVIYFALYFAFSSSITFKVFSIGVNAGLPFGTNNAMIVPITNTVIGKVYTIAMIKINNNAARKFRTILCLSLQLIMRYAFAVYMYIIMGSSFMVCRFYTTNGNQLYNLTHSYRNPLAFLRFTPNRVWISSSDCDLQNWMSSSLYLYGRFCFFDPIV